MSDDIGANDWLKDLLIHRDSDCSQDFKGLDAGKLIGTNNDKSLALDFRHW